MSRAVIASLLLTSAVATPAFALPPGAQAVRPAQPNAGATSCTSTPHLAYGQGPLIQHVKVVDVFYSPGHKYKTQLESYYKAITQSAYFDWLSEYNAGSYKISRGSFLTSYEDTNPNPTVTKQVAPQTYLKNLLSKLPPPDDDTIYMIYFPSHIDPTIGGGGGSCISGGGFCAYHSSFTTAGGQLVRYSVMPDMEAGSCANGCGPPGFNSFTDVSSHELIEAVTDPDGGSGWYDNSPANCGEIGDICATGGMAEGGMVNGYFVQNEWSNKNSACITVDPTVVVNAFTVAAAPPSVDVAPGGTATTTIQLTKTAGAAENVALSTVTPPSGIVGSFAPASISSASGMSTLTVTASATASVGTTQTLTVKATGSSTSPTVDVTVKIVAPPDMAMSPDMAQGGGGGGGSGGSGGSGGTGGNGNHPGNAGGCSCDLGGGGGVGTGWAGAALLLLGFAIRRRRA